MDLIFKALNDPARRDLLDCLREKDGQSLSDLEPRLDMTRFGVMKHLGVLEEAGLITTRREGRFKYHYLNALPLQEVVDRWIEPLIVGPAARSVLDLKTRLEGQDMSKPDFVMSTFIRCTQDALWDALTDPEQVVQYHFMATRAEGHLTREDGAIYYVQDNKMLEIRTTKATPKTRLEFEFHPHWGPDMASSRSVYILEPRKGFMRLTVEHFDIPEGQEGVIDGWERLLSGIKTWLETGEATRYSDMGAM